MLSFEPESRLLFAVVSAFTDFSRSSDISSRASSVSVPSTAYDPFAEELRLCGGEGRLNKPSALLAPDIKISSPVPLRKLGELEIPTADVRDRTPYPELRAFDFLRPLSELRCFAERRRLSCTCRPWISEREVEVDSGLGGKLETLALFFDGSGKAPILVVLRTVFPGVGILDDSVLVYGGDEASSVAWVV